MLKTWVKKFLPQACISRIKIYRQPREYYKLRKSILSYYKRKPHDEISLEERKAIKHLSQYPLEVFPQAFTKGYSKNDIIVSKDQASGLHFIVTEGKRLYFKRSWSVEKIRTNWNMLLMEQDQISPHRYLTSNFNCNEKDIVADIGCAEGNFSLSIIEKVAFVHLYEADPEWMECLAATFMPWEHKVAIINKYVSAESNENTISLDGYFNNHNPTFLKIDVEGFESGVLEGADNIIRRTNNLKIAIATYHNPDDAEEFSQRLTSLGFTWNFSEGVMLYLFDQKFSPPYFRKCLLRATKCTPAH